MPINRTTLSQVQEFHKAFGHPINDEPTLDNFEVNKLRYKLLVEEVEELGSALVIEDPVEVLDALLDIQYVLDGAFLALGFHKVKADAFAEVHASNMSKLGADGKPIYREDGKILKGPNFFQPDLSKFIGVK